MTVEMNTAVHPKRGRNLNRAMMAGAGLLLVAVIGLQLFRHFTTVPYLPGRPLSDVVPAIVEGWMVKDEPLGPTESTARYAEKTLGFDEFVHRTYSRGPVAFSIYVAHWSPGRMHWKDVALHTPDVCWVGNGWVCTQKAPQRVLSVAGRPFAPGQWREFVTSNGGPMQVLFWHALGGRVLQYDQDERFVGFRESVRQLSVRGREQYFIRISSTTPLEQLVQESGFQQAVAGLGNLVLWRDRE